MDDNFYIDSLNAIDESLGDSPEVVQAIFQDWYNTAKRVAVSV